MYLPYSTIQSGFTAPQPLCFLLTFYPFSASSLFAPVGPLSCGEGDGQKRLGGSWEGAPLIWV